MPEEVGITEKLDELFASLFMRKEEELLPEKCTFLSEKNETQKRAEGQTIQSDKVIRFLECF